MRKPKLANQDSAARHSSSVHYFAIVVMILTACSIAMSGCSKFRFQEPAIFNPEPQPQSLTQRQQLSVEEALAKQDAQRLAAQEEAEAAAIAEAKIESELANTENETDPSAIPETDLETQQQDIVAEAAQRNSFQEAMMQVAQVSYESEIDETEDDQPVDIDSPEVGLATETVDDSVRLFANADDFEGVPVNFARDELDFSQANLLRPSTEAPTAEQLAPSDEGEQEVTEEVAASNFGNAESLRLPLQPMLFNPETRTTKSIYEGTLRPLKPTTQDFETEAVIAKASVDTESTEDSIETSNALETLTPLRTRQSITLENRFSDAITSSSSNSRILRPLEPTESNNFQPPKIESPIEVAKPEPIIESAEIFVIDAPIKVTAEEPQVAKVQLEPMPVEANVPRQPVVDASLSNSTANYLQPKTVVPAEVFEDAIVVAEDLQRELTATVIPSESDQENNDFKVQAVSNTTVTSVCNGCGSETCSGCDADHADRGEPMFSNNDFAAPTIPDGDKVVPMVIPPATVPVAQPEEMLPASSEFGDPVNLTAPPETDSSINHIAALPIVGGTQPARASNVPPVGISTLMELNAVTWKSRLDEAIELAEVRLNRMKTPSDSGRVNLRLLKALRGQMEQMENSTATVEHSKNESQYWQHQLEAITTMLQTPGGDSQAVTDYNRHQAAHETLEHLRHAVSQLESIASLKVTSGQFCTAISGFGKFRTFPTNTFSPGQKMLIYCEVENYTSSENQSVTGTEFRTRLKGSFAIYDADGNVVQQAEFPSVDDVARKHRRDFYMYMPVTLGDLQSGEYVLHALVEDIYGNKTASLDPPLKFSVK